MANRSATNSSLSHVQQLTKIEKDHSPSRRRASEYLGNSYNTAHVLYNLCMTTIAVSEAREKLPDVVRSARTEAVFLERYGRAVAVLISPERYEQLITVEENAAAVAAYDAAMSEEGPNIPWDQVKADLGWQ